MRSIAVGSVFVCVIFFWGGGRQIGLASIFLEHSIILFSVLYIHVNIIFLFTLFSSVSCEQCFM